VSNRGYPFVSFPLKAASCLRFPLVAVLASFLLIGPQNSFGSETVGFVVKSPLYRTNLGINNLGADAADVRILLQDNIGQLVAQGTLQVAGLGFVNVSDVVSFLAGRPFEIEFEGFVRIESSANIAAFAAQILNETNDPGFIASVREGVTDVLLPVTTSIDPWRSSLAIVNLAGTPTTVRLALFEASGNLVAAMERVLEPNSQWTTLDVHAELGLQGVRGHLEVQSLDAKPLAVVCRHSHVHTRQSVFQQPCDLKKASRVFYLPYSSAAGLQRNWVVLSNPGGEAATVNLLSLAASGIPIGEASRVLPAHGSVQFAESELFAVAPDSQGLIRGSSSTIVCGMAMNADLSSGDTIHTSAITEFSPELLIPSATRLGAFSSSLLLANLGEMVSPVQLLSRKPDGSQAGTSVTAAIPAGGTVQIDKVLPLLGISEGYGPLEVRSGNGQPIAAFSQVANISGSARGLLNVLDIRPVARKRRGEFFTLRWRYHPLEIPRIREYRIYLADKASRVYRQVASVPPVELQFSMQAGEIGEFVVLVKAFDGTLESAPSNEVLLEVRP